MSLHKLQYKKPFEGLIKKLERRYRESDSIQAREEIKRYLNFRPCPECGGARLNRASRSMKVGGLSIHEVTALSVSKAHTFFNQLKLSGKRAVIAKRRRMERRKHSRDRRNSGNNGLIVSLSTRLGKVQQKRERRSNIMDRRTDEDPGYTAKFSIDKHAASDSAKKEEIMTASDRTDSVESRHHINISA